MVFAVEKHRGKIHDRISRQVSAFSRSTNALLDRGNEVVRNRAAENVVHKFKTCSMRPWLEFDAANRELSVAACLLFVFAFRVGFSTNGFQVGNLRRLQS